MAHAIITDLIQMNFRGFARIVKVIILQWKLNIMTAALIMKEEESNRVERERQMLSGNEYQELAMRTNDRKCTERLECASCAFQSSDVGGIVNASLGLSGETGELNDMIKKAIFHGHELEEEKVKKELGDIMWYVAMMCESFGFEMEEIMQMNIDKLKARYPEGFSEYDSLHRKEGDI